MISLALAHHKHLHLSLAAAGSLQASAHLSTSLQMKAKDTQEILYEKGRQGKGNATHSHRNFLPVPVKIPGKLRQRRHRLYGTLVDHANSACQRHDLSWQQPF